MGLHKIEEGKLIEYSQKPVSTEFVIHDFIENHPDILGQNIFIIGREVKTDDGSFIDLLGLNQRGDTIVIEIKKEQTPRKVIGQILEYAEWVSNSIGSDELNKIAKIKHLSGFASLWEKFKSEFGQIPDLNEQQLLYIIAEKVDPITEKLARYLRKNGIDIFCMEINFYEKDGHKFCDTKTIVGKEKVTIPDSIESEDETYDWKYYSQRRGWSDETVEKMKKFVSEIIDLGKKENWNLDLKFNRRSIAIQTKKQYNVCVLKEKNGLVRIESPAYRKTSDPPKSELNWQWSESQSFWQANFLPSEMPSVSEMKNILKKSYTSRE